MLSHLRHRLASPWGFALGLGMGALAGAALTRALQAADAAEPAARPALHAGAGGACAAAAPTAYTLPLAAPPAASDVTLAAAVIEAPQDRLLALEAQLQQQCTRERQALLDRVRDPRAKASLLKQYQQANPQDADRLRLLLQDLGGTDTLQFAMRLAGSADASQRAKAYALLQASPHEEGPQAARFLRERLLQESDPAALAWLVDSVDSKTGLAPPERLGVAERLSHLTQHPDPELRAKSLGALSRWSNSAEVQTALFGALADPVSEVQIQAIQSLTETRTGGAAFRQQLWRLAQSPVQSLETRQAAVSALEQLDLTPDEFAGLIQARDALRP